jgi:hypothetical protein
MKKRTETTNVSKIESSMDKGESRESTSRIRNAQSGDRGRKKLTSVDDVDIHSGAGSVLVDVLAVQGERPLVNAVQAPGGVGLGLVGVHDLVDLDVLNVRGGADGIEGLVVELAGVALAKTRTERKSKREEKKEEKKRVVRREVVSNGNERRRTGEPSPSIH